MTNGELRNAIQDAKAMVDSISSSSLQYAPLLAHLQGLLAIQVKRAEHVCTKEPSSPAAASNADTGEDQEVVSAK